MAWPRGSRKDHVIDAVRSDGLVTDWNNMMKELFRTVDGVFVDQTRDSVSSSGIASDDHGTALNSTISSPGRHKATTGDSGSESMVDQQVAVSYRYRHSDMTPPRSLDNTHRRSVTSPFDTRIRDEVNRFETKDSVLSDRLACISPSTTCTTPGLSSARTTPILRTTTPRLGNCSARTTPVLRTSTPGFRSTCSTAVSRTMARLSSARTTPALPASTPAFRSTSTTPVLRSSSRNHSNVALQLQSSSKTPHISGSSRFDNYTPVCLPDQHTCSTPLSQRPIHRSTPAPWLQSSNRRVQPEYNVVNRASACLIDFLPDEIVTIIFASGLNSLALCRCAAVCRRWNRLVWNPVLWTCVNLGGLSDLNVNLALKCLTRILSRDTPSVCVTVVKVVLNGCRQLTDQGLYTVARRCTELNRLEITGCKGITNVALFEVISRCVSLVHLDVTGCDQVSCISLTPEANMAAVTYGHQVYLRVLDMSECVRLDDVGVQLVASYCPSLVKLFIRRCPLVTDRGVQYIAAYCNSLRELSLSDCRHVTDFGVGELASRRRSSLRYLSVARCSDHVTDASLEALGEHCGRLRYLNVRGCTNITNRGVEALSSGCVRLRSLDIGECDRLTDYGLMVLAGNCRSLRRLSVRGCASLTDAGIGTLSKLCRHLEQLNVQNCPSVTRASLQLVRSRCVHCIIEHNNFAFY